MQNTGNGPSATVQLVLKINKWQERKIMQNKLPIPKQQMPKVKHKQKKRNKQQIDLNDCTTHKTTQQLQN